MRVTVNGHSIASQWRAVNVTCAAAAPAPFKVLNSGLVVKYSGGGNVCPNLTRVHGWFRTTRPGRVAYVLAWANGRKSKPQVVNAVRESDGRFIARFNKDWKIPLPIKWTIRTEVQGQPVASKWTPVQVRCRNRKRKPNWQSLQQQLIKRLQESGGINSPN